ncbi:hypothetical protein C8Q70DRAFT_106333 [Cubamyces menziesii]|nr:hypothetical protein C8Q70DRAFT_106333 [Cubamyces menziesii]
MAVGVLVLVCVLAWLRLRGGCDTSRLRCDRHKTMRCYRVDQRPEQRWGRSRLSPVWSEEPVDVWRTEPCTTNPGPLIVALRRSRSPAKTPARRRA